MRRAAVVVAMAVALAALGPIGAARADDGVTLSQTSSLVGEHVVMEIEITVPNGATVEVAPGTPSWAGIELVGVDEVTSIPGPDGTLWYIRARVAPFLPGTVDFAPTLVVVADSQAIPVVMPAVRFTTVPILAPDAELVLSPLDEPMEIGGAESPFLRPAIYGGIGFGALVAAVLVWLLGRFVAGRMQRTEPVAAPMVVPQSLEGAELLLDSDPVGAYRLMSSVVKTELARRYGLRATALTTTELRRRLESGGDRWQARLVGGLLEECDSVIYAGYRPASERRQADLTMAREIVEVTS